MAPEYVHIIWICVYIQPRYIFYFKKCATRFCSSISKIDHFKTDKMYNYAIQKVISSYFENYSNYDNWFELVLISICAKCNLLSYIKVH